MSGKGGILTPAHLPLADGARVAIVGGGPAGSFFGVHLLKAARRAGRRLAVTIFEPKTFSAQGPAGCNKSAGILSPPLLANLDAAGLSLPPRIRQGEIGHFALHLPGQTALVPAPEKDRLPVTVYRGGGPKRAKMEANVSFDGWLLDEAIARGATVTPGVVLEIHFDGPRPQLQTSSGGHETDLVVLATGLNGHLPSLAGLAYQPPQTETMAQGELPWCESPGDDGEKATAHVFFDGLPGLVFAALVPKGPFVSVSLLGAHLPGGSVRRFLAEPEVRAFLGATQPRLCGCRPRIAVQPAKNLYADRFVAVGDAAVSRLYKDGIGSAFLTAQAAARTAIQHGVGPADWAAGYAPTCRAIERDNGFGRRLFALWSGLQHSPRLERALLRVIGAEAALPPDRRHWQVALWAILTGSLSYRSVWRHLLAPRSVLDLAKALW